MNANALELLLDQYEERFGGSDEVVHLSIVDDPRFAQAVQQALQTGQPLTREALEAIFGGIGWEE